MLLILVIKKKIELAGEKQTYKQIYFHPFIS